MRDMSRSFSAVSASVPVRSLDDLRPGMVKADLGRNSQSDGVCASDPIGLVVEQAVMSHYGSVKAAAYALKVDPSLMQRELKAGNLRRLDDAEDAVMVKAVVAEALANAYVPLADPKVYRRRLIQQAHAILNQIDSIEVA